MQNQQYSHEQPGNYRRLNSSGFPHGSDFSILSAEMFGRSGLSTANGVTVLDRHSSRNLPLKLVHPFYHGLPDSIRARFNDSRVVHSSNAFETNSGSMVKSKAERSYPFTEHPGQYLVHTTRPDAPSNVYSKNTPAYILHPRRTRI